MRVDRAVTEVGAIVVALVCLDVRAANSQSPSHDNLIRITAVVTDEHGQFLNGLTSDDFVVEDSGRRVPIVTCAIADADRATTPADGRFLVLVLDDSDAPLIDRVKETARDIAALMSGHDVVGVVGLSNGAGRTTTDREAIVRQIDQIMPFHVPTVPRLIPDLCPDCDTPPLAVGRPPANPLEAIDDLARQLRREPHRRKTIVFIGPASRVDLIVRPRQPSYSNWLAAIRDTGNAGIVVEAIDVLYADDWNAGSARGLVRESGGRVFYTTDLAHAAGEVWNDASHYYAITYVSPPPRVTAHEALRPVRVRVLRRNVSVTARRSR